MDVWVGQLLSGENERVGPVFFLYVRTYVRY